jgi:hypothetical protein
VHAAAAGVGSTLEENMSIDASEEEGHADDCIPCDVAGGDVIHPVIRIRGKIPNNLPSIIKYSLRLDFEATHDEQNVKSSLFRRNLAVKSMLYG